MTLTETQSSLNTCPYTSLAWHWPSLTWNFQGGFSGPPSPASTSTQTGFVPGTDKAMALAAPLTVFVDSATLFSVLCGHHDFIF